MAVPEQQERWWDRPPWSRVYRIAAETYDGWTRHDLGRLSAALAYFGAFTLLPLLTVLLGFGGRLVGEPAIQEFVFDTLERFAGAEAAAALASAASTYLLSLTSSGAIIVSALLVLWGATSLFRQITWSVRIVWDHPRPDSLKKSAFIYLLSLIAVGILTAVIVGSVTLLSISSTFGVGGRTFSMAQTLLGFVVLVAGFTVCYEYLSGARPAWRYAVLGAAPAALVYTLGTSLLGIYLEQSRAITAWGAAGAVFAVLIWLYFSSYVFLAGAEFGRATESVVTRGQQREVDKTGREPVGHRAAAPPTDQTEK